MNLTPYITHKSMFPSVQQTMIEDCQFFADSFFEECSEYALKTFINTYTESLGLLEEAAIKSNGLEETLKDMKAEQSLNQKPILLSYRVCEMMILAEMKRQRKHYTIFLFGLYDNFATKIIERVKEGSNVV